MADEPRRSIRATKGQHTKSLDLLDPATDAPKRKGGRKANAKKATSQEAASGTEEEEIIRCICGVTEQDDDTDEDWIACESCSAWQHNVCMGVTTNASELEDLNYWCERCKPENHKELLEAIARGEKPWIERRKAHEEAEREAAKSKKTKKGKSRKSEVKPEAEANGKGSSPASQPELKQEKKESIQRSTSTKRKAMDQSNEEPAKNKVRKVSTPQPQSTPQPSSAPSDIPATISELDKIRQGVAKLLYKNLTSALKVAQQEGIFKGTDAELEQKATRLALEIERATHDTHAAGKPYTDQGRKLAANLKTNQELCNRLVTKSLAPGAFAIMTGDEMASKELQRQTAEMKARSDKQSIMLTEEGPRVRRTHKGDEVIESDNFVDTVEDIPASRRRSMLDPNTDMGVRSREGSSGDGEELPRDIDEYHSQDDIRGNAAPSQPLNIDTRPQQPPARKASAQNADFDINKVFSSVQQSPTGSHPHIQKPSNQVPQRAGPGEDADIDRLLEDGNESPPYSPAEYDADPSIVWRGTMVMNGVATFPAVARHIGGADLSNLGNDGVPWSDLIPDKISVAGRIDQERASEYLCSLRYSPHTDIVVVALTPTGEIANDEFSKLFEYFNSKSRYGVVGEKGLANVRDTYLVPVPPGTGNIPEFMLNLENNKIPQERAEPMILIALVIRNPPIAEVQAQLDGNHSPSNMMNYPQRQMSTGGGPAISPIAPQGSFGSPTPMTPGIPPNPYAQQNNNDPAEAQRRQRHDMQVQGEKVARDILGEFISAPTVSFLLPQAFQMQPKEWAVIKELFLEKPEAQGDLQVLSKLLEQRNAEPAT